MNNLQDEKLYTIPSLEERIKEYHALKEIVNPYKAKMWANAIDKGVHFVECRTQTKNWHTTSIMAWFELFEPPVKGVATQDQRECILEYCLAWFGFRGEVFRVGDTKHLVVCKGERRISLPSKEDYYGK